MENQLQELETAEWDKLPDNSTYKKLTFHLLNEALYFISSSVVENSSCLRNRHLRQAPNRYPQPYNHKENVNLQYK